MRKNEQYPSDKEGGGGRRIKMVECEEYCLGLAPRSPKPNTKRPNSDPHPPLPKG